MTFEFTALDADRAEIRIDGQIGGGWFDEDPTTAKSFAKSLKALGKPQALDIYINSPGGSVFDGQAIYAQLKRHKAKKTAYVEGLAASIASVIAMAADEIVIPENALMMVHRASGMVAGDAGEMRRVADTLEKVEAGMIAAYVAKTGRDPDDIQELMNAETWMTGAEAVALGFADRTSDAIEATACVTPDALRHYQTPPLAITALAAPPVSPSVPVEEPMSDPVIENPAPAAESAPVVEPVVAPASASDAAPAVPSAPAVDPAALYSQFVVAEQQRRADIRALTTPALLQRPGVRACLDACLDDLTVTADAASRRLLALLGQDAEPLTPTGHVPDAPAVDARLPLEEQCTAEWQRDPALRAEFGDQLSAYLAYRRAEANGQVRIFKK